MARSVSSLDFTFVVIPRSDSPQATLMRTSITTPRIANPCLRMSPPPFQPCGLTSFLQHSCRISRCLSQKEGASRRPFPNPTRSRKRLSGLDDEVVLNVPDAARFARDPHGRVPLALALDRARERDDAILRVHVDFQASDEGVRQELGLDGRGDGGVIYGL